MAAQSEARRCKEFLALAGVGDVPPATVPFDPGYDPATIASHLSQSAHLMAMLKLSMASWMIAEEAATREKVRAATRCGVAVVTGGGPFEIAAARRVLPEFLDLCADLGVTRVEAGEGFTDLPLGPSEAVGLARTRGLQLQFELGKKHEGAFSEATVAELVDTGHRWLDAGAEQLVIEARESASNIGVFGADGTLDQALAQRFADAYGLQRVVFEAPTKSSQFALIDQFGPEVLMTNVRIEELLRVEIYRRGLHSDSFGTSGAALGPCGDAGE